MQKNIWKVEIKMKNKFINAILEQGVNIVSGDKPLIVCDTHNSDFAREVLSRAYQTGRLQI